jgi:hypothetical protein
MRNTNPIDRFAFLVAMVVTIGIAVLAAWWYNIRWNDIARGFFGFPIFIGMFAFAAGIPVYKGIHIIRLRRYLDR